MRSLIHYVLWTVGLAKAESRATEAELDCLCRHASGCLRGAEIGVGHGVRTRRLIRAMAQAGTLYAIDPYVPGRLGINYQMRIARREIRREDGGAKVAWTRKTGVLAARRLNSALFGFVLIDCDQTSGGLEANWGAWSRLVAVGGIAAIYFPEQTDHPDGPGSHLRAMISHDPRFETLDSVGALTVYRCVGVNDIIITS